MNHLSVLTRRPARPKGTRGQQTRQRLLDAAEAAFGTKGYFGTSVAGITRQARVAQGTFYLYFPSKRAIFSELVRQRSRDLRGAIQKSVGGLADRRDVERAGFVAFFRFLKSHRGMYRIVRQAEFVDPALFRWYYRHFADGYIAGLRDAQRIGQICSVNPEVLAFCLMGVGDFVGMRWVLWERSGPRPEVVDGMMRFILHGLASGGVVAGEAGTRSVADGAAHKDGKAGSRVRHAASAK